MAINYSDWQKIRRAALERETQERALDTQFARPPIQIGVTDQIIRDLIERVEKLEQRTPATQTLRVK